LEPEGMKKKRTILAPNKPLFVGVLGGALELAVRENTIGSSFLQQSKKLPLLYFVMFHE